MAAHLTRPRARSPRPASSHLPMPDGINASVRASASLPPSSQPSTLAPLSSDHKHDHQRSTASSHYAHFGTRLDEVRSRQHSPEPNISEDSVTASTSANHPVHHNRSHIQSDSSSSTSSSAVKSSLRHEAYSSFFDSYPSHDSHEMDNEENAHSHEVLDSRFRPLSIYLHGAGEDEDLRDLKALRFSRSIRMNLDTLNRSCADQYAYNADGYTDPHVHYGAKAVDAGPDAQWYESSYADLISKLPIAQDGTEHHLHDREQLGGEQESFDQGQLTPQTSSSKDSPPPTGPSSDRSSIDPHEDETRTPPEGSFDWFEPSIDSERYVHRSEQRADLSTPSAQTGSTVAPSPADETSVLAPAFRLDSPFQPAQSQSHDSLRDQPRSEAPEAGSRFEIGDSAELELLSDDIDAQRRAAGKARMMPWQGEPSSLPMSASPSWSGHGHGRRRSSHNLFVESNKPFTRLGPQDIAFSASTLDDRQLTAADCVKVIVSHYPSLCDAPLREFGEDGKPLPPTKKQETSEAERLARKEALRVQFCAKQRLSLIKAMVVMESRSASWKRIGPLNTANKTVKDGSDKESPRSSTEVGRLPPMPGPWVMEIRHEQLDAAQIKGKSKKTIELASLRTNAQCDKCDGSGLGNCATCKAEQADECFWCSGTGREKTRAQASCRRCQGAGVLKCNTCHGGLKSDCRSCEGTGTGEYGFFVDVTVKRVEMPAVPISTLFPQLSGESPSFEPSYDEVRIAATLALWDSISTLTEARSTAVAGKSVKSKSKEMVPVMAACVWENSISHIVSVDVPLAAKFKKGATPALRPEGLYRKIPTQRRFFTVPTDSDLRSVEVSEDEVKKLTSSPAPGHVYQHRSPGSSSVNAEAATGSPNSSRPCSASPPMSSADFTSPFANLATPEEGASVSGYPTPSRVPSPRPDAVTAKPAAREFIHRPSPLSQLAALTPSPDAQHGGQRGNCIDDAEYLDLGQPPAARKARRPSAGQILTKRLSSNILTKLGAHRGSF